MENKVLKNITLREGEEDIRELPVKDYRQLEYRLMADYWQYLSAINTTLVHLQLIVMELAKKNDIDVAKLLNDLDFKVNSKNV
jgi:hypothetical protein